MNEDIGIVKKIVEHIENVHNALNRFGNEYKIFVSDKDYFNSELYRNLKNSLLS
jgi:hypothetical protein